MIFPIIRRQDAPKVYDMNASIYVYGRDYLIDERNTSAVSERSCIVVMDELSGFDIDSEKDFIFIEYLVVIGEREDFKIFPVYSASEFASRPKIISFNLSITIY